MKNFAAGKILASPKSFTLGEGPFLVLFSFFVLALVFWRCLDRTVPIWDGAAHLVDTYNLKEALVAPGPLEKKIYALFTCSGWCPPLFNWVHCLILMSPIPYSVADILANLLFFAIGLISLYKLGCQVLGDKVVAVIAMAIYCMLPTVCAITHNKGLIDTPLASMCFLALWLVARWNSAPSLANALVAGCAIGFTCLTKQTGAIYVAPAVLLVLLQRLLARNFRKVAQFVCVVGVVAIPYISWLLLNGSNITRMVFSYGQVKSLPASGFQNWLGNMEGCWVHVVNCITVPVATLFVFSLFNFPAQRKLWLPASTLLGLLILSTDNWGNYQVRYVFPVLGYLTLSVAALLVRFWRTGWLLPRILVVAFGCYLSTIYFIFNFTPYPFPRCAAVGLLDPKFNSLACRWTGVNPSEPYPLEPVAYNRLLGRIQSEQGNHQDKTTLVVAVDTPNCALTSLAYLAKQRGIPLELSSLFTDEGVNLYRCNPENVKLDPDWYVTTENDQGSHANHFKSDQELENYQELKRYFESSGKFALTGKFLLADRKGYVVLFKKM